MPFYEYQCRACGAELEELQGINDAPLTQCEECGKNQLEKKISAAGFRLSGTGWYETDFKKDGQKNLKKAESEQSATASKEGKDSAKPEKVKSETKTSTKTDKNTSKKAANSKAASRKNS